ncbi:metal-dependent phosphohydrolase, partial [Streptomyces sp. SID5606]|nr:metal-dependent phosphohydrolase [Streptomyces sp. SID5606]
MTASPPRGRPPAIPRLARAAAALVAVVCLAHVLWSGLAHRPVALAFGALVALGELTRRADA